MIPARGHAGPISGCIIALLLASACGLGRGGTGEAQGDDDASTTDATSSTGSHACTPLETESCVCPGGGTGRATCSSSGQGFGACAPCTAHLDAGAHGDAGNTAMTAADASTGGEAGASACSTCTATSCPGAAAACGPGTDCQALLVCDVGCSGRDASGCTDDCTSMHPAGAMAFTTYTLCALACGAGCLADSNGPDDAGMDDDASD